MSRARSLLTVADVAEYIKVHPLTVRRYAREGKIPAFKISNEWHFYRKNIEKWLKVKSLRETKIFTHNGTP